MAEPNRLTPLTWTGAARDLGVAAGEMVSLVGGGGKSSLLFALGDLHGSGTVLTATTRMGADQTGEAHLLVRPETADLARALEGPEPVLVWDRLDGPKAIGVDPSVPASWLAHADRVIVEADGARGHPAKAPAPHEPVIADDTSTVVAVMGADALDRVIEDQCHRPLRVAALVGCSPYERLTPERAARLLLDSNGSRRSVNRGVRFTVAITKVSEDNRALVDRVVAELDRADPSVGIVLVADHHTRPDPSER